MATTFKQFLNNDVTTTRTLLHENIPITGSIVSGTYNEGNSTTETNIKNYSHGLFQSSYDYPYLSSSANHIFDITVGYSSASVMFNSSNTQNSDKNNVYNQMAQVLVGHDVNGRIRRFDADGNFAAGGKKMDEVFFVNFARLLSKDEIKKGSFEMEFGVTGSGGAIVQDSASFDGQNFIRRVKVKDLSGSTAYLTNSPAGEYGILYATSSTGLASYLENEEVPVGLVFYQAGVAVISGSLFRPSDEGGLLAVCGSNLSTRATQSSRLTHARRSSSSGLISINSMALVVASRKSETLEELKAVTTMSTNDKRRPGGSSKGSSVEIGSDFGLHAR